MKRLISLLAVLILLMSTVLPASAAPQGWGEVFVLAGSSLTMPRSKLCTVGETNYLFLPAGVSLDGVSLFYSASSKVTVIGSHGQVENISGGKINVLALCGQNGPYTLTLRAAGVSDLKLTLVPTDGIGSMFLVSDDPVNKGRTWVESSPDKSNKATGSMYYCDKDGNAVYDGALTQIKGRGNSTWLADKKPYQIKLKDKTDLLQTGDDANKSKTWVLLTNHSDTSGLRNNIVYDMSVALGMDPGI